jgi:hypothetical protein
LTDQIKHKLEEIRDFCEAYCEMETQEIAFVDQKQAEINNKKKIELIKQINSEITSQSPGHLGEGL